MRFLTLIVVALVGLGLVALASFFLLSSTSTTALPQVAWLPAAVAAKHSPQQSNAPALNSDGDLVIYDDALTTGWLNWSWAAANVAYTATTQSGHYAIQTDLDGWSAFSPFYSNHQDWEAADYSGLSTTPFDRLSFWVHRGASPGGQQVNVRAADTLPGWEWLHTASFTVPGDDDWHEIVIPLRDLDMTDSNLSRLAWSGNGSETQPILLDAIKLRKAITPTVISRDPMVNSADQLWLYRDQRNSALLTSYSAELIHQSDVRSSGAFALAARFQWYGGIVFRPLEYQWETPAPFALQHQNVLRFLVNRGATDHPDQRYEVHALDAAGDVTRRTDLNQYLSSGSLDQDIHSWQLATIPLDALQPEDGSRTALYAVAIQEMSGVEGATDFLYLDEVRFETVASSPDLQIYGDRLHGAWGDYSWDTTTLLTNTTPVQSGTASIAAQQNAAWGGLYLRTEEAVSTIGLNLLRFSIHGGAATTAGSGHQQLRLFLVDATDTFHTDASMVITLQADQWQAYEIPLEELGRLPQIKGIVWQNTTSGAQAPFYIDNVTLSHIALPPTPTPTPVVGPALHVDAAAVSHPISPYIYGMNYAEAALAADLKLPVHRWGGNGTTRYNWQLDTASHTSDWYFENIPKPNSNPAALPVGSAADQFIHQDRANQTATIMTMPMIGWTPKSRAYACGFSVAKYGPQQSVDPWRTDCGNGIHPDGSFVTGNDPTDSSLAVDEGFVEEWLAHLIAQFGTAAEGGVPFYNLDNEPMLWNQTHRDVHPAPVSYEEIRERTYRYAATIKAADPTAKTLGPATWGWTAYFWSALDAAGGDLWWTNPQDRLAHVDMPFTAWYLQEMQAYEAREGVRLLDYLDLHYYPRASGVALAPAGGAAVQAQRLRSTRSLWDANYVDESWIAEPVRLIPRMREWVEKYYPGTKLAITEYNWGALNHMNGALAQADVLGIFGREGLDLATLWDPPKANEPGAFAFRLYRNYDGNGSTFGDQSLMAASSDQEQLSIYAARRSSDGALTIMVINKSNGTLNSNLTVSDFLHSGSAQRYRYSSSELSQIVQLPDVAISHGLIDGSFPKASITLFVLPVGSPATITPTPSTTATMIPKATATVTPIMTVTPTATATPTAPMATTKTATATATETGSPGTMATKEIVETATATASATPTTTPIAALPTTPTETRMPSATPTVAENATATPTVTPTPTATFVETTMAMTNVPTLATATPIVEATVNAPATVWLYLSSSSGGRIGNIRFADEDILAYAPSTDSWMLLLDGSDIGLATFDIDALNALPDGSFLLSLDQDGVVPDVGQIGDEDILHFVPSSLGNETTGHFSLYFDGSDVGLDRSGEDIDALALQPDGRLLISTLGSAHVGNLRANDEDLLLFTPITLGEETTGSWALALDGSAVALSTAQEDLWGVAYDSKGDLYLSTLGAFALNGLSGDGADLIRCQAPPSTILTDCLFDHYWAGSLAGFGGEIIDAFALVEGDGLRGAAENTALDQNGEAGDEDDDAWNADEDDDREDGTEEESNRQQQLFLPIVLH